MAEQLNLQINIGGKEQVIGTLGELKKAIKEAEFEALKLSQTFGEADPRVLKLREQIGKLKDQVSDSAAATANFAKGAGAFPVIARSLQGVASGFAAIQGAMGLLGVESEDVAKTLLKVQSALALATGLEAVVESIDQFQNLAAVIENRVIPTLYAMSTATKFALGVVIGAITTAIASWVEYENQQERVRKQTEENAKQAEKLNKAQFDAEVSSLERSQKFDIAYLRSRGATEEEIFQKEQFYRKQKLESLNTYYNATLNKDSDVAIQLQKQIKDAQNEIQVAEFNHITALNEIREKEVQDEKDRLKRLEDERRDAMSRMMALELQALENRSRKKKEDDAAEEAAMQEKWGQEQEVQTKRLDLVDKRVIKEKEAAEAMKDAEQALYESKWQLVGATIQLLASFAGQNEKYANALFVVDKAVAIAKIIVDAQREIAAAAAWNQATFGPAGPAITAKQALGIKLRAGASIASIAALTIAKFKTGSTAGFGGGTGTLGVTAPIQAQLPAANLTQLNQATINALGNQAIRAYVIETDMTTNQQRIQAIRQRARFG